MRYTACAARHKVVRCKAQSCALQGTKLCAVGHKLVPWNITIAITITITISISMTITITITTIPLFNNMAILMLGLAGVILGVAGWVLKCAPWGC